MSSLWARVRTVWAVAGSAALLVFVVWSLLAYRANGEARAAMHDTAEVSIRLVDGIWHFQPTTVQAGAPSLLFFPGGLVEPTAYAPLLGAVAARGHRALLVSMPRRGAFGGAEDPALLRKAHAAAVAIGGAWVVSGHSKGGKVATLYAAAYPDDVAGLVLIGTSHPRDVDLSAAPYPAWQLLGGRDRIASIARADGNRHNLPAATSRIVLDGGNHSQFGDYGFQPGDRFAQLPRVRQRERTLATVLDALAHVTPSQQETTAP